MNFDFNETSHGVEGSGYGSFQDILKMRNQMNDHFQEGIKQLTDNYDGELIGIVRIKEDENGEPEQVLSFVGGIGVSESVMRLAQGLAQAAATIVDKHNQQINRLESSSKGKDSPQDSIKKIIKALEDL